MELDGNVLAGDLAEVFTIEMTSARFTCAGCRHTGAVAALRVWTPAPGTVARCPSCGDIVLTLVRTPARVFLTLSGASRLELPLRPPESGINFRSAYGRSTAPSMVMNAAAQVTPPRPTA